jgi:hypothetical protein
LSDALADDHRLVFMNEGRRDEHREQETVTLRASRSGRFDITRSIEALIELDWLGPRVDERGEIEGFRRVVADLELPILDGSATGPIRKSALIDVGIPRVLPDFALVDVGWQSASMAPLFPVFAGQLRITARSLVLDGRYVPPFGRLGLVIDAGILHFVARRTAQAFLARLAARSEG